MAETPETGREHGAPEPTTGTNMPEVDSWFAREVLPLEGALIQFLRHNWRNRSDIEDLLQDVYVRVYEAALKSIPERAKPFVFATARNLLINRVRREQVVPIEAASDLDALGVAIDEPGPDRSLMARDELRVVQAALEKLPPRCREAIVLGQVEGLSRREIAQRMGIGEGTVKSYLAQGAAALADIFYGENVVGRLG
jgi:RNA polymerase sigma-70 factor (ECF subfamily)